MPMASQLPTPQWICGSYGPKLLLIVNLLVTLSSSVQAFVPRYGAASAMTSPPVLFRLGSEGLNLERARPADAVLFMSSFFDDIGRFFDEMSNGEGKGDSGNFSEGDGDEESDYVGSTRVLTIPVESVKVGGLRLYLLLYLMGQQNTPDKGSWKANQVSDSSIDMYYHDGTAALMINFQKEKKFITVDRLGSLPSMQFVLQESTILDGLLDELDSIASDSEINETDRLICLAPPGDAIKVARSSLSFS